MGSKLSSLCSKKKTKKKEQTRYSPRTEQQMYNARRTAKLIYPPLSSTLNEEPKRSVRPDGRPIYESVHMDVELNDNSRKYDNARHVVPSHFPNYYNQYDNGTFAVFSRQPMNSGGIFRI